MLGGVAGQVLAGRLGPGEEEGHLARLVDATEDQVNQPGDRRVVNPAQLQVTSGDPKGEDGVDLWERQHALTVSSMPTRSPPQ